jgi:hypothetical protein
MQSTLQQRLEAAQNKRFAFVARLEDAHRRMEVATRAGDGPDPADATAFEDARLAVLAADVELRELGEQARASLGGDASVRIDVGSAAGMGTVPEWASMPGHARVFGAGGRVDTAPLQRALGQSSNYTSGRVVLRTLLQGVAAGTIGRTRADGGVVAVGNYGAVPLVLAVEVKPTTAGIYYWNRVEAVTAPALGAKQASEGAAKANVELKSTPVSSTLETYAAYEKVSLQSLQDQDGLLAAVEALLTGAVLRAADADAWTAFAAGATAVTPDADGVSTIVKTAALIAANGGSGIRAVLNPVDYAAMMLAKADTSGNWMGLPPGVEMPGIVQSGGVPSGKLLVTASSDGAFVALRQNVEAAVGLDGNDWTLNLRTALVEARMVANVRNAHLAYAGDLVAAP